MKNMEYLSNVVSLQLKTEKCTACGMCVKVCPHQVFEISDKKAHIINRDSCMECGACSRNCAFGAISVRSGVGCAAGIINGILNNTEPTCECSGSAKSKVCC
jgi:NAD-dependent dihydropyrimidine dehydrogenase PreA subunit